MDRLAGMTQMGGIMVIRLASALYYGLLALGSYPDPCNPVRPAPPLAEDYPVISRHPSIDYGKRPHVLGYK